MEDIRTKCKHKASLVCPCGPYQYQLAEWWVHVQLESTDWILKLFLYILRQISLVSAFDVEDSKRKVRVYWLQQHIWYTVKSRTVFYFWSPKGVVCCIIYLCVHKRKMSCVLPFMWWISRFISSRFHLCSLSLEAITRKSAFEAKVILVTDQELCFCIHFVFIR